MHARVRRSVVGAVALALGALSAPALAQNRLVNMVPAVRSGETNQDAEPTLAIDPNDYRRMAGSAFTWDNLNHGPMVTATAPIYVSQDGGATWTMAYIVPSSIGAGFPTGDITLSFGGTLSGAAAHETSWLYGGILSSATPGFPMTVLRAQDYLSPTVMTSLDTQSGNVDQPHTRAMSSLGGSSSGEDKLYVGFNNGWGCAIPNGRTSTLDVSQSGSLAAAVLGLDVIEARNTSCQDGFSQVTAPHLDGTVYGAFLYSYGSARLVVVRDDAWGTGSPPFSALTDPSDSVAGRFVTPTLTLPSSGLMGQQRLYASSASNVSVAVDPRNSDRVYVAYGDSGAGTTETIHVRRSINRGVDWSGDLLTVTSALDPAVAINALGTVGVLYQRVVSNRWETHLTRTTDADATTFDNPGVMFANTDATAPVSTIASGVYVGDYASLLAAGKNFYGMFSASNYPDTANFLPGVVFGRYADWTTHTLYADAAHTTTVPISIDPYFFEADAVASNVDFYVRDWTDDATHGDNGAEPSTHAVFYATSDVWNGRSSTPLPFNANDQPVNADAGNGAGNIGDNWAYARVRRNVAGPVRQVQLHFLVSKFGTGSNFVDASSMDPDVSFPDPDPVIPGDATAGPWISPAYHWHLNAIAGNHLCLAVQISAPPEDSYIPPSLTGAVPGWGTGTDLRIISDNDKAQRNMHLSTVPGSGSVSGSGYAIVHNGALVQRDVPLRIGVSGISKRYVRGVVVRDLGTPGVVNPSAAKLGQRLVLRAMQPGENRWVRVDVQTAGLPAGSAAFVTVDELAGNAAVSGFGVGFQAQSLARAIADSLEARRALATRLDAGFKASESANDKPGTALAPAAYVAFVRSRLLPHLASDLKTIGAPGPGDPFGIAPAAKNASAQKTAEQLVPSVTTLLDGVDSYLTMRQLQRGDPADILQMVRWQKQLFRQRPKLAQLPCARQTVAESDAFVRARESGKLTNAAYPQHLRTVSGCIRQALGAPALTTITSDLAAMEKEHHDDLVALAR